MSSNIYLIKYGCDCFPVHSLVKFEAISNSGDCYLVSDINDDSNRKWLMYWDLYKMVEPPKTKNDQEKMGEALNRLAKEDPSFRVSSDKDRKSVV